MGGDEGQGSYNPSEKLLRVKQTRPYFGLTANTETPLGAERPETLPTASGEVLRHDGFNS